MHAPIIAAQSKLSIHNIVRLGDRTGDARPDVFNEIITEIKLLHPDFIIGTGNLIEGQNSDTAVIRAEWDSVLGLLKSADVPCHFAPGDHDVFDSRSESVYTRRVGRTCQVLRYGNSTFILLANSRWPLAESLPPAKWRWLDTELARSRKARHTFVLMHRPYWRYALDGNRPNPMHELLKKRGADYVFTGHEHFYCSSVRDSIRYFQVGPSGGRTKVYDDRAEGAFQNYLFCRVSGESVTVTVREPGKHEPMPPDIVTFESSKALEDTKRRALTLAQVNVPQAIDISAETDLAIENVTAQHLTGTLTWHDSATSWRAAPREISYSMTPGGRVSQRVSLTLGHSDSLYPLPSCSLHYEYIPGRSVELRPRLPVRRQSSMLSVTSKPSIDGRLDDPCWQVAPPVRSFGSKTGDRPRVEPTEVWIGADDSTLYIAARCRETRLDRLRADVTQPDGRVCDDDHLEFVLDPERRLSAADSDVYYQIFVNALGTVADRKYRLDADKNTKDNPWNGRWRVATGRVDGCWTVEMSCPLPDLGPAGSTWGLNVVRFQSRLKDTSVWQAPFEHDPSTFGVLAR